MSSSRIDPMSPPAKAAYKKKHSKQQKNLPTMDKEFKLMNRINELPQKMHNINESIELRRQFLQNQKFKNLENEAFCLRHILQTHRTNALADGQFRPITREERHNMQARVIGLTNEANLMQPIIGAQGRYNFA